MKKRASIFYVGQPADDVLYVAKRTNRKITRPSEVSLDGVVQTDVDTVNPARDGQVMTVRWFYPDVTLTFARGRGKLAEGALCYRVTEIEMSKELTDE